MHLRFAITDKLRENFCKSGKLYVYVLILGRHYAQICKFCDKIYALPPSSVALLYKLISLKTSSGL